MSHIEPTVSCPKCAGVLQGQTIGKIEATVCIDCGGLWLEHASVIAYIKKHLETLGLSSKAVGLLETPPVPAGILCPSCRDKPMFSLKLRGVEVEQCRECRGTFFDAGELYTVAKRLSFAAKDSAEVEARRTRGIAGVGHGPNVDRMMGDLIHTALDSFDVDL